MLTKILINKIRVNFNTNYVENQHKSKRICSHILY